MASAAAGEAGTTGPNAGELFGDGTQGAPQGATNGAGGTNVAGNGEGAEGASAGDLGAHANGADMAWLEQLSGDVGDGESSSVRDWVKSKNFKDMTALARSAWHAEKALHESGKVKVPGEGASESDRRAFFTAIGVPEDAKGYEVPEIKDKNGEVVPMNTALLDRLAGAALKGGVPKAGFAAIVADFVASQMEEIAGADAEQHADAAAKLKEWGNQKPQKMVAVQQALDALGLNRDEAVRLRAVLGAGRSMDIFAKLGEGLAEDRLLPGGNGTRFGISGADAQAQIDEMRGDKATRDKIMVPGTPERARYDRLVKIAGEEAERQAQNARLDM